MGSVILLPRTPAEDVASKAEHSAHLAEPRRPLVACLCCGTAGIETFDDYCERMARTHRRVRCGECAEFVWIPKHAVHHSESQLRRSVEAARLSAALEGGR